jgi:hypothetical protein
LSRQQAGFFLLTQPHRPLPLLPRQRMFKHLTALQLGQSLLLGRQWRGFKSGVQVVGVAEAGARVLLPVVAVLITK